MELWSSIQNLFQPHQIEIEDKTGQMAASMKKIYKSGDLRGTRGPMSSYFEGRVKEEKSGTCESHKDTLNDVADYCSSLHS